MSDETNDVTTTPSSDVPATEEVQTAAEVVEPAAEVAAA
jgi:hypothetical protein